MRWSQAYMLWCSAGGQEATGPFEKKEERFELERLRLSSPWWQSGNRAGNGAVPSLGGVQDWNGQSPEEHCLISQLTWLSARCWTGDISSSHPTWTIWWSNLEEPAVDSIPFHKLLLYSKCQGTYPIHSSYALASWPLQHSPTLANTLKSFFFSAQWHLQPAWISFFSLGLQSPLTTFTLWSSLPSILSLLPTEIVFTKTSKALLAGKTYFHFIPLETLSWLHTIAHTPFLFFKHSCCFFNVTSSRVSLKKFHLSTASWCDTFHRCTNLL